MTLMLLANLGFAGGDAAVAVDFGDLTTLFVGYVEDLRDASLLSRLDSDTEVALDLATVRAAEPANIDDANTMYTAYLS